MVYRPNSITGCGKISFKPRPVIKIDIRSNVSQCGKTTIAVIIHNALKAAGFKNVNVLCLAGDVNSVASGALDNKNGTVLSREVTFTEIFINDSDELFESSSEK